MAKSLAYEGGSTNASRIIKCGTLGISSPRMDGFPGELLVFTDAVMSIAENITSAGSICENEFFRAQIPFQAEVADSFYLSTWLLAVQLLVVQLYKWMPRENQLPGPVPQPHSFLRC